MPATQNGKAAADTAPFAEGFANTVLQLSARPSLFFSISFVSLSIMAWQASLLLPSPPLRHVSPAATAKTSGTVCRQLRLQFARVHFFACVSCGPEKKRVRGVSRHDTGSLRSVPVHLTKAPCSSSQMRLCLTAEHLPRYARVNGPVCQSVKVAGCPLHSASPPPFFF